MPFPEVRSRSPLMTLTVSQPDVYGRVYRGGEKAYTNRFLKAFFPRDDS